MFTEMIPGMHVALGFAISYFQLAMLINKTRIAVTSESATVPHGPLPWPGRCKVSTADIDQLYCREIRLRTTTGLSRRYEVWVAHHDGSQARLLRTGLDPAVAPYIKQQIETALGIPDREMPDELPR